MQDEGAKGWTDRWLAELAEAQHGVVGRAQLLSAGLTLGEINSRIALGRLYIVRRGVYAVGRPTVGAKGNWLAVVLSLGDSSVLSHETAAALWGLRPVGSGAIHVTLLTDSGRKQRAGVTIHRSLDVETTAHDGIPVTTPARTLLDLAATLQGRPLQRAIERAVELRLFDLREVQAVTRRGRRGGRALLAAVAAYDGAPTRSELERRFLALCREQGITRPLVNTEVAGFEVDFGWPDAGLVVETDGHEHHGTPFGFERDRRRDAALTLAGWRVARFSWRQVVDEPDVVGEVVRAHLRRSAA